MIFTVVLDVREYVLMYYSLQLSLNTYLLIELFWYNRSFKTALIILYSENRTSQRCSRSMTVHIVYIYIYLYNYLLL